MNEVATVVANLGATVAITFDGHGSEQAMLPRSLPLLVAGDRVELAQEADGYRVVALITRDTELARCDRRGQLKPLAANLTHLGIVSANPPGIDTLLIDQFCLAAAECGLEAIIIVNKRDITTDQDQQAARRILDVYGAAGYATAFIDTVTEGGLDELHAVLPGKSLALVGASGVGKSSIVAELVPERDIRVGAVSAVTGLGAHTTSVTRWYPLEQGASMIDSPGVRQYSVAHVDAQSVRQGFPDIRSLAEHCRFANCAHLKEPGCKVREAVADGELADWRYDNYRRLLAE